MADSPYYQRDGITILHGDCADLIGRLSADLVLTDPPYGIGEARGRNASRCKLAPATDYGVSSWDDEPIGDELIDRVISAGRCACVFGGNYYALPASSCWLVWDKQNGDTDFADCELAWTNYGTAVRMLSYRWNGMIRGSLSGRRAQYEHPRYHPTQKPVAVMSWAISKCPGVVASVLDPFMGSGTTLVAAQQLGLRAVGIEREEQWCEVAAMRLSQPAMLTPVSRAAT